MVRKHRYTPLDAMNDAQILTRASSILAKRLGDQPLVNSARKLLLGTATAIRSEVAATEKAAKP